MANKTKNKYISERGIERRLQRLLEKTLEKSGGEAYTFRRLNILSDDAGVVIQLANGQEFQLTIVESTR